MSIFKKGDPVYVKLDDGSEVIRMIVDANEIDVVLPEDCVLVVNRQAAFPFSEIANCNRVRLKSS